ncbi:MAG TPA: ATP-binding protein, partial [Thermoanaerobaculia bacterium]|nr:ATP-binding protein [Thermoanaerobaculia bacterium]
AEIHRAVARSPRLDAVLQLIVAHAAELVEADLALLLLVDSEGLLRVRAARGAGKTAVWEITVPREDALGDRLREILGLDPEDALLSAPIVVDPSVHGMLLAIHRAPRRPGERVGELLEALGDAAAIALINVHLQERMRSARSESERRTEALMRLQEASVALLRMGGERPSLDALIEILCQVTGAPRGVYWLLDDSGAEGPALEALGTHGVRRTPRNENDQKLQNLLLRVDLGSDHPVARAARSMTPVALPDTCTDQAWEEFSAVWGRTGIRSILAVPLRARGRLLGVVALFWREAGRCIDGSVLETAEVTANQIAAILDTAELVEELSRANRLKDEFLAMLSHELRNPLNAIASYATILENDPEARQSTVVRKAAAAIRRNADTQARLVSDLLDLSRLRTDKLAIHRQPVLLAPLVAEAVEAVRAEAEGKGLALEVETPEEPILAEADPVRVQQIVWNLLQNAVKFTPEGGRVTVRLRWEGEASARLDVEDSGQGVAPEFLPRLFEMFSQEDAAGERQQSGLGIGLALVRQLAELHGGRVQADSEGPGRGSRFTVWLPLWRAVSPLREEPSPAAVR